MSIPFNWEPIQHPDGAVTFRMVLEPIIEQMRNLEEEATREAVIAWLREHGYTVEKKKEA